MEEERAGGQKPRRGGAQKSKANPQRTGDENRQSTKSKEGSAKDDPLRRKRSKELA